MPRDGREETYKAHAAECLEIARQTDDREGKIALLDIARAWLVLADQHRKNSQTSQGWKSAECGKPRDAAACPAPAMTGVSSKQKPTRVA